MNGTEPKIEIFAPFGAAFEWMKRMLFQPFDFTKWLVVGFAAFLANLSSGTNFNFTPNLDSKTDWSFRSMTKDGSNEWLSSCGIPLLIGLGLIALIVAIAVYWVGCRGRFIFADCIVRNRGAIAEPWREYGREGNSFFLFTLLVGLISLALVAVVSIPIWLGFVQGWTEGAALAASLTIGIVALVVVIVVVVLGLSLIYQLMVPIMYRQRCLALPAFRQVLRLIAAQPGQITLYLLLFIVLCLGAGMIACVSLLACCVTLIPYVGTVILLPVHVVMAAFPLFFMRQFGDAYDVWATIALPAAPPVPPAETPPGPSLPPPPVAPA